MPITIKDIAEKLKISESTVSRALSDNPRISDKTKDRVKKLASELNYRPNLIAKSLKIKTTKTIGLIIDDITNPFYPEIVKGCEQAANENGLNIILCNSAYDSTKEFLYLNILLSKRVDGVLMMPAGKKIPIINALNDAGTPLVFIDIKPSEKINVSCVYTDQEYGAYIAAKYLFDLGHRRIALINGPNSLSSCQQMENGYKKALEELCIPLNQEYIKVIDLTNPNVSVAMNQILELKINFRPTSALFISDITAVAAYDTLQYKGLNIPDDFSIIGNDDIPTSKNFSPPLTTLSHPKYEMGRKALEILLSELHEKDKIQSYNQVRYIPELIIRKSTSSLKIQEN